MSSDRDASGPSRRHGQLGRGVSEMFREAVTDGVAGIGERLELLPEVLVSAAATVLEPVGAQGAGVSVFSDQVRLPLAASSPSAALVEQLQFTLRQGPCWSAVHDDTTVVADGVAVAVVWPEFAAQVTARTSFRSVVSVPVRVARGVGGALDVYFDDPTGATVFDVEDAVAVAAHVADRLATSERWPADDNSDVDVGVPRWARSLAARARWRVWVAAGMLRGGVVVDARDAVALLRARGYRDGRTVDDLADDVIAGQLTRADLVG